MNFDFKMQRGEEETPKKESDVTFTCENKDRASNVDKMQGKPPKSTAQSDCVTDKCDINSNCDWDSENDDKGTSKEPKRTPESSSPSCSRSRSSFLITDILSEKSPHLKHRVLGSYSKDSSKQNVCDRLTFPRDFSSDKSCTKESRELEKSNISEEELRRAFLKRQYEEKEESDSEQLSPDITDEREFNWYVYKTLGFFIIYLFCM